MAAAVDKLFEGKTVLCDGAMGTMLYSCGVFINRCYDELNVTQPETVRTVHEQYLQAGAQVIETNTFGANAYRLEHYGLREKVRDFNLAGAKIARQCVTAIARKAGRAGVRCGSGGLAGADAGRTQHDRTGQGAGSVRRADGGAGGGWSRPADRRDDDVRG